MRECQSKRKGYSCVSSKPHPGKGLGVLARLRLIKFRPRGYLSAMGDVGEMWDVWVRVRRKGTEEEEVRFFSVSNSKWNERCRSRLCRPPVWMYGAPPRISTEVEP